MCLSQLAEKHGNELVPATESFSAFFRLGLVNYFKELALRKKL